MTTELQIKKGWQLHIQKWWQKLNYELKREQKLRSEEGSTKEAMTELQIKWWLLQIKNWWQKYKLRGDDVNHIKKWWRLQIKIDDNKLRSDYGATNSEVMT